MPKTLGPLPDAGTGCGRDAESPQTEPVMGAKYETNKHDGFGHVIMVGLGSASWMAGEAGKQHDA